MSWLSKALFAMSALTVTCGFGCGIFSSDPTKDLPPDTEFWQVAHHCGDDSPGATLHLRKEPFAGSTDQQDLSPGAEVAILGVQEEWTRVLNLENPKKAREGWVHVTCIRPQHTDEVYRARLSAQDHVNSKGKPLREAVAVVRQDRANVHKFGKRDSGDLLDSTFGSRSQRSWLTKDAIVDFAPGAEEIILNRTPYVQVHVGDPAVFVEIIEPGESYTAPKKQRRKKADPDAVSRCVEKWCNSGRCPGDECPEFDRCLGRAGVPKSRRWGCWAG